jgi:hypothetical protein
VWKPHYDDYGNSVTHDKDGKPLEDNTEWIIPDRVREEAERLADARCPGRPNAHVVDTAARRDAYYDALEANLKAAYGADWNRPPHLRVTRELHFWELP